LNPVGASNEDSTCHLNFKAYYVRNRYHLAEFWFLDPVSRKVVVSTTQRAKFAFRIFPAKEEPLLLVADDLAEIAPAYYFSKPLVYSNEDRRLELPASSACDKDYFSCRFSELARGGFGILSDDDHGLRYVRWALDPEKNPGEAWILCAPSMGSVVFADRLACTK
jgi:hypothetical protein